VPPLAQPEKRGIKWFTSSALLQEEQKAFSQASFGEFLKEEYSHVNITSTSFSLWERSFGAA
jgi:hypothetical protein